MRYTAAKNPSNHVIVLCSLLLCAVFVGLSSSPVQAVGGSTIQATVCQDGSQLSVVRPTSDSTVTEATIPLKGTVVQATQIEVYVDDEFDHIIPLTSDQTAFSDSVALSPGTRTIKLTAIDRCSSRNDTVTRIVTYTPPPSVAPSEGGSVPTEIVDGRQSSPSTGVAVTNADEPTDTPTVPTDDRQPVSWFKRYVTNPLQPSLRWLNIGDADSGTSDSLSIIRAIIFGGGLLILVFGVGSRFLSYLAESTFLARALSGSLAVRMRRLSWMARFIGLLLVIVSFWL